MNLLLFEPDEMNGDGEVVFSDRRSEHIIGVLGCKPGDTVKAGIVNGPKGTGVIVSIHDIEVVLRFTPESDTPVRPAVDLILGLVRPIMLKRILAQAASLGVGRIFLVNANRVEKSFFGASLLKDKKYQTCLIEGLEQAKDTFMPEVSIHQRFRSFVEDFIPAVSEKYDRMLLAHPEADLSVKQALGTEIGGRTLLAVGPEGGWVDFEIEKFIEQSFVPVSLGERILRTDTAVVALLSQLMVLYGE